MTRFGLATLTMLALGGWMATVEPAAAGPDIRESFAFVEVQYRAYDRPYYRSGGGYREERRDERRALRRERERQVARQAYRAGRRDAYNGRPF